MVARARGTSRTPRPWLSFGYSRSSRVATVVIAAWACSRVVPGARRPIVLTNRPRRCSYQFTKGSVRTSRFMAMGTHISGRTPTSVPVNEGGITPTIV